MDGEPDVSGTHEGETPLRRLLELQDTDVHVDQLAYRRRHLPEQAALDPLLAQLASLDEERLAVSAERLELTAREVELERETAALVARVAAIEERARSAAAGSYRDQEAMAAEIEALGRRRSELEELELEVLEAAEPLDARLAQIDADRAPLVVKVEAGRVAVSVAAEEIDAAIAAAAGDRSALAAGIPALLLGEYEALRQRLDGVGVARLVRGVCAGCHLALPATEVDRLHKAAPGSIAHCEQCGRILVP
jgi:predicted  nucleic acid-binding Zn-ribbon protein